MAEYTSVVAQDVTANQNVLFNDTVSPCNKGYVLHRPGSGQFTVRGCTPNCRAKYRVEATMNVAIPTGGTVAPVSVALAINGEPDLSTQAVVTPAAAGDLFNVTLMTDLWIPKGADYTVAIRNTSADAITVQNANITINREG